MPELPEVETTRRGIAPHAIGKRIAQVSVYDPRLRWPVPPDLAAALAGQTIRAVDRRSKYLLFRLDDRTLLVHLGMTGRLRAFREPPPRALHDHVDLTLHDGTVLRYHDPRRFGAMLLASASASEHPLLRSLGPEPLEAAFDVEHLFRATRGRRTAIKLALMDNRLVVGVGNIYASEALFRAGIRPTTPASRLSRPRLARLLDAVRATLEDAIRAGGSTVRDYAGAAGEPGSFQRLHGVYGRDGERCRRCPATIRKVRQGGRSTFYCPKCQR